MRALTLKGPGLSEKLPPPSQRGRRHTRIGSANARNRPTGYDSNSKTSGRTTGAGWR